MSRALFLEHLASSEITLSSLRDETIISYSSLLISTCLKFSIFSSIIVDLENLVKLLKFSSKNFDMSLSTIISAPSLSTMMSPTFSRFIPNFITAPR